jgi:hypothetical protein
MDQTAGPEGMDDDATDDDAADDAADDAGPTMPAASPADSTDADCTETPADAVLRELAVIGQSIGRLREAALWSRSDAVAVAGVDAGFSVMASFESAWLSLVRDLDTRPTAVPKARAGTAARTVLRHRLRRTEAQARADVRAAWMLAPDADPRRGGLPRLGAAFAAGRVSREHVEVACRTKQHIPEHFYPQPMPDLSAQDLRDLGLDPADPAIAGRDICGGEAIDALLTEKFPRLTSWDAHVLAERLIAVLDPDGCNTFDPAAHERRQLTMSRDRTGMWTGRFALDPAEGEHLKTALDHFSAPNPTREEVVDDGSTALVSDNRSAAQRRADALAVIARLATESPEAGTRGGEPPHIVIHADPDQIADLLHQGRPNPSSQHQPSPAACPSASAPMSGPPPVPTCGPSQCHSSGPTSGPQSGPTSGSQSGPTSGAAPETTSGPTSGQQSAPTSRAHSGPTSGPAPQGTSGSALGPTSEPVSRPTPEPAPDAVGPLSRAACADRLAGGYDDAGRWIPRDSGSCADTSNGTILDDRLLGRFLCDSVLQAVFLSPSGAALSLGRSVRLATTAQRKALTARDRGCVIPNCGAPAAWTEAHHVTYWSQGGCTDVEDMCLLCPRHHTEVHLGIWVIQIRDGVPWVQLPGWVDPQRRWLRNTYNQDSAHVRRIGTQLRLSMECDEARPGKGPEINKLISAACRPG